MPKNFYLSTYLILLILFQPFDIKSILVNSIDFNAPFAAIYSSFFNIQPNQLCSSIPKDQHLSLLFVYPLFPPSMLVECSSGCDNKRKFFYHMGTQTSYCEEQPHSPPTTANSDYLDDFNLTTIDSSTQDPLHKFLRSQNTLQVKTLNQLLTASKSRRRSDGQGERLTVERRASQTLQEQIANRIRHKTAIMMSVEDNMQILHLLEEQIQSLAQQRSDKGEQTNINSIDRGKVFSKLKINLSSFIRITHDSATAHYQFLETIGQGSFGKVYRAICKRTKQQRAIKVLKKKIASKQDAQFLAEFNLLSQLDHPNIVKLYQIFYYRSFYYVVMEYCKGGSIIDLIKRLRQFPEGLVACIAQQLLSALAYLHQRGIVHRDIKLDNIVFLERESGLKGGPEKKDTAGEASQVNYHIKIIDFGTAIRSDHPITKMAGTRYYMAPQVFRGVLHEKSDIWSCGVFLYVFFTGKFPFMGNSLQQVQHQVTTKTVTFIQREWKDVSIEARRLILGMLERSVEKRVSAKEALGHGWFKRSTDNQPPTYSTCNLDLLERYQRGNNLIAIIENYLSLSAISQAERERLAVVFRRIDSNNDGTIEANELISIFRQHFGEQSEEEVAHVLEKIDQNGSGRIDFNEFLLAMFTRKKLFLQNALTDAFNHYDCNKDGFLQRSQLISLLEGCQREEIQFLLEELDENGDDRVSLGEFLQYMRKYS